MSARPKPGAITWPLTSDQVELIDAMFESLFSDVNNGALDITLEQIEDIETGSILIGDEDGVVSELPISTAAGAFLRTDGTTAEWSTLILPNAASQGSILYALSADNIAALAKNASATRYLSNTGASNAPAWAQVELTNGVSGILPIANGGTNKATWTAGSVVVATATNVLGEDNSGLFFDVANNRLGVGVASPADALDVRASAPIIGARMGGADQFASLRFYEISTLASTVQHIGSTFATVGRRNNLEVFNANASGSITFHTNGVIPGQMVLSSAGVLSLTTPLAATSGGTGLSTFTQGDTIYSSAANTLAKLAKDTNATRYLSNTGASNNPAWAQVNLANGVTGTLPVANGGSGTTTAFTLGSVIFAGASGVYSQDNANFFWDDTNNRLGLGTATPIANSILHVTGDLKFIFADQTSNDSTGSVFIGRKSRNGAALQTNDQILGFQARGHDGTNFGGNAGSVDIIAAENFTSTNQGAHMRFVTTPIGSTTAAEVARITSAGSFGIGTASPSTRLHVLHNQNAGTDITVENTTDGANAYVGLSILGNGGAGGTLRHWAPSSSITRYQDKFVFNSNSSASGVLLEADAGDIEFLHGGLTRFVMKSAGWFVSDEADTDPGTSVLDATDSMAVYMKSNKFVIAYNNAGTITYISIPMDGSTTTWTHNTTAP